MAKQAKSYRKIAERLNADCVLTGHGGRCWYPATVRRVELREAG